MSYQKLINHDDYDDVETTSFHNEQIRQENVGDGTVKKEEIKSVSFFALFKFASWTDILCIIFGTLVSIFTGVVGPLQIVVFGNVVNDFRPAILDPHRTTQTMLDALMPTIMRIVYLGICVLLGGYISQALWIFSGENQARRIRQLYVHSILRQDNAWFDAGKEGSMNTRLSNDTQLVQDAISEKAGATLQAVAQFIAGMVVAFFEGLEARSRHLGLHTVHDRSRRHNGLPHHEIHGKKCRCLRRSRHGS